MSCVTREEVQNTVPDLDSVGRMETEGVGGFILDNTRNCDFLSNQGEVMMVITSEPSNSGSYTSLRKPHRVLQLQIENSAGNSTLQNGFYYNM